MRQSHRRLLGVVILICASAVPVTSYAWEFELEAGLSWNYYYASQAGQEGFFGPWNVDLSGNNIQNQNFWAGRNKWAGLFPGADVAVNTQYMELIQVFTLNEAITIEGAYYVGSWIEFQRRVRALDFEVGTGFLRASEYPNSFNTGTLFSFSPGYWNLLWFSAETPWGTIGLGKRPFVFGLGSLASGDDVTSTEAMQLTVPYGPLRLGVLRFPWRFPEDVSADFIERDAGFTSPDPNAFIRLEDQLVARSPHLTGLVIYTNGPLEVGYLYDYFRWSVGPESVFVSGGTPAERALARSLFIARDLTSQLHILYAKYFNGRFFWNGEVGYWESTVRHQPNVTLTDENSGPPFVGGFPGAGSVYQTNYTEMWRYLMETGVVMGPTKITLLGSWTPGFDRRAGALIDKQGAALWAGPQNTSDALFLLHPNWANTIVYNPYNYLIVFNYGGGNEAFNRNGDGYLTDAFAYAVRLDYAVAANLNVWGSFFKAHRVSKGYGWGFIKPDLDGDVTYERVPGFGPTAVPAIPEDDLGWEVNAGMDWALLDGLELNMRFSYGQPGKWFNYACVSRANPGWAVPNAGNLYGTIPDRTIDPVAGLEVAVTAAF